MADRHGEMPGAAARWDDEVDRATEGIGCRSACPGDWKGPCDLRRTLPFRELPESVGVGADADLEAKPRGLGETVTMTVSPGAAYRPVLCQSGTEVSISTARVTRGASVGTNPGNLAAAGSASTRFGG